MRYVIGLVLVLALFQTAHALTPLPDHSPDFFAGEWAGTSERGAYCYLKLSADGRGVVLIDSGGAGDWLGARIQWRNRQQALEVERIIPLPATPQLRIMPLSTLSLRTEFNQFLRLSWSKQSNSCHMQRIETTADHLTRARRAIEGLQPPDGLR